MGDSEYSHSPSLRRFGCPHKYTFAFGIANAGRAETLATPFGVYIGTVGAQATPRGPDPG